MSSVWGLVVAVPPGLSSLKMHQRSNYQINHVTNGWIYLKCERMFRDSITCLCQPCFALCLSVGWAGIAPSGYGPGCERRSWVLISCRANILLSNSAGSSLPGGKVAGAWGWTFLPSVGAHNGQSYTSTSPIKHRDNFASPASPYTHTLKIVPVRLNLDINV
jgi:hypothetical protein